jgi:hypothetical protein
MTFWTAVAACAAVVAAVVAAISALSSKRSNTRTGIMQGMVVKALGQVAETAAPTMGFRVDPGTASIDGLTGFVLRNIGSDDANIVTIKPDVRGKIYVEGLPVTLKHDQGHPFDLFQGSIIWGTTDTIAVNLQGEDQPVHVAIPQ